MFLIRSNNAFVAVGLQPSGLEATCVGLAASVGRCSRPLARNFVFRRLGPNSIRCEGQGFFVKVLANNLTKNLTKSLTKTLAKRLTKSPMANEQSPD